MRSGQEDSQRSSRTHFLTIETAQQEPFFRQERWALALLNTLRRYQSDYDLHDFVIMPDHVELLVTPHAAFERTVQLIKGGFAFNARRAFAWKGDVWQSGFLHQPVRDAEDYRRNLTAIKRSVRLLNKDEYRFCGRHAGLPLAPAPPWFEQQEQATKPATQEMVQGFGDVV